MSATKPFNIPFYRPYLTGNEQAYLVEALAGQKLSGNGPFTKWCQSWLESRIGNTKALLTQSCTAALEMSAILADILPGDEVILPSFTFVTSASAFVLRGGVPVFVDIRPDTLNLDESLVEAAITSRTRAILAVHYAGLGCDIEALRNIATRHNLFLIEDAAQGILSSVNGRPLGSVGHLSAFSFHDTKNIISGEGGALLINDERLRVRAEILWEKGTDRNRFLRGEVDKYSWVDIGSSYLPSELTAAVLKAQLEAADAITNQRVQIWHRYYEAFADIERAGKVRRPALPGNAIQNGHIFYLLLRSTAERDRALHQLNGLGIGATFHFVPLHTSPAGLRYGRAHGALPNTVDLSARILRLPMLMLTKSEQADVITQTLKAIADSA